MKKYLVINSGSESHKHALYEDGKRLYFIHFEIIAGQYFAHETVDEKKYELSLSKKIFDQSLEYTVNRLLEHKIISDKKEISAIGIRIVAPGIYFQEHRLIDKEYEKSLKKDKAESPLHIDSVLKELKFIRRVLPGLPIVGVSDSAFHRTLNDTARYYALPLKVSREFGVYKYGYHGLSVQSVISRAGDYCGKLPGKVVVCHLGGGSSVTAVLNGQSVDTSMGFTPTDGLVMATRSGSMDPGALVYLSEKLKKRDGKMLDFLNKESGLLGLSGGKSSDIRDLLKNEQNGDIDSKLALDIYADRVKKYIAQAVATMNGLDLLILAGTVGERSMPMREKICSGMEFFGIELDKEINLKTDSVEREISTIDSRVKILIIKTDEMGEIAREISRFI